MVAEKDVVMQIEQPQPEEIKVSKPVVAPEPALVPIKDCSSNNYMPIKALNTFTKDWVVKARISSKQYRVTQKGVHLMKLEIVDELGT